MRMKLRDNNLRVIHKNVMKLRAAMYSNCGADVPEYTEYAILVFVYVKQLSRVG